LKNRVLILLVIWLGVGALISAETDASNDKSGTSSLIFLRLGAGARAVAMGEAFTAQSDGMVSPFWNPAAISGVQRPKMSFTHTQWFQDVTAEFFSSAIRAGDNVFGLSLSLGEVPDIEKRETPTEEPLALFDAHDFVLSFSYARNLGRKYSLGFSAKWIYEKIDVSSASGMGFDLGGIFTPFVETDKPFLENLSFGAAIMNVGSKIKFKKESYSLPTEYKAGVSYSAGVEKWQSDYTLCVDLIKPRDDDMKTHLGGEYGLYGNFNLRLGYQIGCDDRDISFGMGVKYKKYAIDYAFLPYKSDLGDVHCISLDVEF
jgi:hypothetical protein